MSKEENKILRFAELVFKSQRAGKGGGQPVSESERQELELIPKELGLSREEILLRAQEMAE